MPRTMERMKPVQIMSFGNRAEPEEEMDDIEVEDDDDTPMKRPDRRVPMAAGHDAGGSGGMSGSQKLLAFRFNG